MKKAVVAELESFFFGALNQCVRDGASVNDLVHVYLDCAGLEYRFQFNKLQQKVSFQNYYFNSQVFESEINSLKIVMNRE